MTFIYEIENNSVKVPLVCTCDYDYCTDQGPSAYLTHAMVGDWNMVGLMTKDEREEIEDFYLENWRELDK
jgi:hypothetical protein